MASTRNLSELPGELLPGLVAAYNQTNAALASMGVLPHHDTTPPVTAEAASSEGTSVALANDCKAAYVAHIASTAAHETADTTNTVAAADATNLASAITLLNELKADFNAHIVLAAAHRGVTGAARVTIGTVSTTDASDQPTANALANALKAAMNAHFGAGAPDVELVAS